MLKDEKFNKNIKIAELYADLTLWRPQVNIITLIFAKI
jgi:hypothetical protein